MNKKYWPYYRLIQDINLNDSLTMGECRTRAGLGHRIESAEISKTRARTDLNQKKVVYAPLTLASGIPKGGILSPIISAWKGVFV